MDAGNDGLERDPPIGMGLGIEEDLRVFYALAGGPFQVCPGQVVEILLLEQYPAAGVIDVEERLQVAEYVGAPDLLNRGIGQANAVSAGQREHQLGFEGALDVKMQLGLGQVSGEGREVPCHSPHHTVVTSAGISLRRISRRRRSWNDTCWRSLAHSS